MFYKGPLLISARSSIEETLSLASLLSIEAYKRNLKDALLRKKVVETRANGKMKISRSLNLILVALDNHE